MKYLWQILIFPDLIVKEKNEKKSVSPLCGISFAAPG